MSELGVTAFEFTDGESVLRWHVQYGCEEAPGEWCLLLCGPWGPGGALMARFVDEEAAIVFVSTLRVMLGERLIATIEKTDARKSPAD